MNQINFFMMKIKTNSKIIFFSLCIFFFGMNSVFADTAVNGICGTQIKGSIAPQTGLCDAGTPSTVSGSNPWTWTCGGVNGGTSINCSAVMQEKPKNNYACGVADGVQFLSAPTTDLCTNGKFSGLRNANPWTWDCGDPLPNGQGDYAACATKLNPLGSPLKYTVVVILLDGITSAQVTPFMNEAKAVISKVSNFQIDYSFLSLSLDSKVLRSARACPGGSATDCAFLQPWSDVDSRLLNLLPNADSYVFYWNPKGDLSVDSTGTILGLNGGPIVRNNKSISVSSIIIDPKYLSESANPTYQKVGCATLIGETTTHELIHGFRNFSKYCPAAQYTFNTVIDPDIKGFSPIWLNSISAGCYAEIQKNYKFVVGSSGVGTTTKTTSNKCVYINKTILKTSTQSCCAGMVLCPTKAKNSLIKGTCTFSWRCPGYKTPVAGK
jgi:hypothetical protein